MRALLLALPLACLSASCFDAEAQGMASGGLKSIGGGPNEHAAQAMTATSITLSTATNPIVVPADGEICLDGTTCDYKIWYQSSATRIVIDEPNTTNGTYIPDGLQVANVLTVESGGIKIPAAGTAVTGFRSTTSSIDFGATAANTCEESGAITLTGAAVGNTVTIGTPAAPATNSHIFGYVSAADTVRVRRCNVSTGALADPAAETYRIAVIQF